MSKSRFVIALVVLLLAGCSSWFEEDNSDPPADLVDFTPALVSETLWQTNVSDRELDLLLYEKQTLNKDTGRLKLQPVIQNDRIFIADQPGLVKALNRETGKTVWRADIQSAVTTGPGVGSGLVIIGSSNAEVIALDQETGELLWRQAVSSEVLAAPAISGGRVVVHTIDGKVYCLEAATGKLAWVHERQIPLLTLRGSSTPVISGSLVIVGFSGGKMIGLDLNNGDALWEVSVSVPTGRSELERIVDIDADPVLRDGVAYAASYQGELAAVTEDTGTVLWRYKVSSYAGLDVDHKNVYVADSVGDVWAIDTRTGSALWKQDKLHGRKLTAPRVIGDTLLLGDFEGYLHWLSVEDGRLLARDRLGYSAIASQPAVAGDVIYVYNRNGSLAALRTAAARHTPDPDLLLH